VSERRLVAALACRAGGSRLYGKPLQNLAPDVSILDHVIKACLAAPEIDEVVLGISEGQENQTFVDVAHRHGIGYIFGDQKDVLMRLVQCGRAGSGSDVFRITTECPFTAWEFLGQAWARHVAQENDITATEYMPEGVNFEILSLAALERSHRDGIDAERSEFCTAYPRRKPELFRIEVMTPPEAYHRPDVRLTVDYPEDLILCRRIWEALGDRAPHIPIRDVLKWVDENPDSHALVSEFVDETAIWDHVAQSASVPLEQVS